MTLEEKIHDLCSHRNDFDNLVSEAPELFEEIKKCSCALVYDHVKSVPENFEQTHIVLQKIFFGYAVQRPEEFYSDIEIEIINMLHKNYKNKIHTVLDET